MRITIIEMSPEELNRFGTVEDLTDQVATAAPSVSSDLLATAEHSEDGADKSAPGLPKKYPQPGDLSSGASAKEEAGGAVSTCHGGSLRRRNDCDGNFLGEVRNFGQELWAEGDASLLDLVALTMEHFGLTTAEFARIIGANRSTVSRYLNHGQCREAVLLACTNFFGYGGSPKSTQSPGKSRGEAAQMLPTATFGGK